MKGEDGSETLTSNNTDKANTLSEFFSSVFTTEGDGECPMLEDITIDNHMLNLEIKETDVEKRLHKLNISKSPGPDNIHPRILHDFCQELAKPVTIIFRKSIESRRIPVGWGEGCITALFKKGNRKLASNYRPVSLTCILCKLLETFVRDHIVNFMKENLLFSARQFGFITGRSTVLQLLYVLENWTKILDEGGRIDCVYLDFMKAFDKVPHRRLLHKLRHYCISEELVDWIGSFLSNRKQRVRVIRVSRYSVEP